MNAEVEGANETNQQEDERKEMNKFAVFIVRIVIILGPSFSRSHTSFCPALSARTLFQSVIVYKSESAGWGLPCVVLCARN